MTSRFGNDSPSCDQRIDRELRSTLADLRQLWRLYRRHPDLRHPTLGALPEYGLCFDYVAPDTYAGQREAYWRYQLSWGGPSDEFRLFSSRPDATPYRIEYWFLDWFDGAHRVLEGDDEAFMIQIWGWFRESGAVHATYVEAS